MANTNNTTPTAVITLPVSEENFQRIAAAFQRDATADKPSTFDGWLLGIILDWVEEVEKPAPERGIGFGN